MSNTIEIYLHRAEILLEQNRYTDAISELQKVVAQDPENAQAFSYLAICNAETGKLRDAFQAIEAAIRIEPNHAVHFYVLSKLYIDSNKLKDADQAIMEALRLQPFDPEFILLKAHIEYLRHNWHLSLEYAQNGLQLNAEHVGCLNMRAMSLVKLNRASEAYETIEFALRREPENSHSHANFGWTMLESGQYNRAFEHFKEALRLDPNNEYARTGLKEAIKSKNRIYRIILKYFLWVGKLRKKSQWILIIVAYIIYRIILYISENVPAIAPVLYVIIGFYVLFAFSTWIAMPLSNLFLRLHPLGKHALNKDEVSASNTIIALIAGGLLFAGASFLFGYFILLAIGVCMIFMLIPVGGMFIAESGTKARRSLRQYVVVLSIVGALGILLLPVSELSILPFFIGVFIYGWIANYVIMKSA